jgi:flagellar biosynthesis/type III secretory pathway protein FliH
MEHAHDWVAGEARKYGQEHDAAEREYAERGDELTWHGGYSRGNARAYEDAARMIASFVTALDTLIGEEV